MGINDAIAKIEERILAACARSGRDRAGVRLMGVTKFHQRPLVEEAWNAGLRLFGESRVQEATAKFSDFQKDFPGTELHLIGALQRNKVKSAAPLFDCIESVDRDELIDALGALSGVPSPRREPLSILLELNAGEISKGGYAGEDSLFRGVERTLAFPRLKIRGLMTMAPFTDDKAAIRKAFRNLRLVRDKLKARFPEEDWSILSMGMSGDFEIAIEEGSTLIRIGTALFGERVTP
ncbi:MAG: YggS family pyridoxal phosphate-dependent enzyme [Treponema sp.]|jgi:pyridoxal phosphate enzyme (YggS family)|nr:YggS family pyridoxal phosphate-dependent enzyme [Treponema sp.]